MEHSVPAILRVVYRRVLCFHLFCLMLFSPVSQTLPYNDESQYVFYADDICIWATGYKYCNLKAISQSAIKSVVTYLKDCGLCISPENTVFIIFPGKRQPATKLDLCLGGSRLPQVANHRFLGISLNQMLKWTQ